MGYYTQVENKKNWRRVTSSNAGERYVSYEHEETIKLFSVYEDRNKPNKVGGIILLLPKIYVDYNIETKIWRFYYGKESYLGGRGRTIKNRVAKRQLLKRVMGEVLDSDEMSSLTEQYPKTIKPMKKLFKGLEKLLTN